MNAIVWYLLVSFSSQSGVAMIPQVSREACIQQSDYIMAHRYETNVPSFAYCVYGVKP